MKHYEDYKKYAIELKNKDEANIYCKDLDNLLSFTPYIYNSCSANCRFCSEKLVRNGKVMVCNEVNNNYRNILLKVFEKIKSRKIFLSLSGKEPTESCDFLHTILQCTEIFEKSGGVILEKVMYSNLSGFCKDKESLINMLKKAKISRIECSRHHFNEKINQSIVNFKKNEQIMYNNVFTDIVRQLTTDFPIRMVCVLQKKGISSQNEIIEYLEFAMNMGVSDIVFRELAMFDDSVEVGTTTEYIIQNRVELMSIIMELDKDLFSGLNVIQGYYYYSFQYKYKGMRVSFEISDYEEMIRKHNGDKLYKLILYPNGKLCTDWNMSGEIDI